VEVYLFEELSPQDPELAKYTAVTDTKGEAKFDVSGVFGVGLVARGYEPVEPDQTPAVAWRAVWTAWGAVGVARDIDYTFTFRKIYVPSWWERRSTGEKAFVVVVPIALFTAGLIGLARKR